MIQTFDLTGSQLVESLRLLASYNAKIRFVRYATEWYLLQVKECNPSITSMVVQGTEYNSLDDFVDSEIKYNSWRKKTLPAYLMRAGNLKKYNFESANKYR